METTKLFHPDKIRKFFDILDRLTGSIHIDKETYRYKDYQTIYTKDSHHCPSTREVFVHRTVDKWLRGKYLIFYRVSGLGAIYKQYVSITRISYLNDWGSGRLDVGLLDYIKPFSSTIFGGKKIKYNDALSLEGEWCENGDRHYELLKLSSMDDVPDKEYIFSAYDWSKYPKKVKKGTDPKELMKTTKSFVAKTEHQAYKLKRKFEEELKEHKGQLYIADLIEVKPIN